MDVSNEEGPSGQLQLLSAAAAALARSADLDATVHRLLTMAIEMTGASVGIVYLQDPDRVELQLGVAVGVHADVAAQLESSLGGVDDAVAQIARDRTARSVEGADVPRPLADAGTATAVLRALTVSRGGIDIPVGVLLVGWDGPAEPAAERDELVTAIGDLAAVAIDRARLASMILERS